jgi:hypothetical protein
MNIFYKQPQGRENVIIDHDLNRYNRILRLRQIAQEIAAERHDCTKLYQADRLLTAITSKLNSRFHNQNRFNFN